MTAATATILQFKPRVGRGWAGGMFAGRLDGYHLVVGACSGLPLTWAAATLWARDLTIGRGSDWTLPTLRELCFLAEGFPRLFKPEVYWTCEELTEQPSAHVIHFGFDGQPTHWGKIYDGYAIAVRRIRSEAA